MRDAVTGNIFMFPGQSSRDPGMLERLLALRPAARTRIEQASSLLGRDLVRHYRSDNVDAFATNRDVQVGVFLVNHLFLEALEEHGVAAEHSLGLSLGEYNHLVHIGCLDFESALALVDARGAAYDQGAVIAGGSMASVFPISLEELEDVVVRARSAGLLEIANRNSPQQFVISGEHAAIAAAGAILEDELAIEPVVIEKRVPMHCSRFRPVAELLRPALEAARWTAARRPYLPNVLAKLMPDPSCDQIIELLSRHVYEPVEWRASIDLLADRYPDATFIEVGPRAVLHNLLAPRWRRVKREKTDCSNDVTTAFSATVERLRSTCAA